MPKLLIIPDAVNRYRLPSSLPLAETLSSSTEGQLFKDHVLAKYNFHFHPPVGLEQVKNRQLILTDLSQFCEKIENELADISSKNARNTFVYDVLKSHLEPLMKSVQREIDRHQIHEGDYRPKPGGHPIDKSEKYNMGYLMLFLQQILVITYHHYVGMVQRKVPNEVKTIADVYQIILEITPHHPPFVSVKELTSEPKEKKTSKPKDSKAVVPVSLPLKGYYKHENLVKEVYDYLEEKKLIASGCKANFTKLFSGDEFKEPVVWLGHQQDLYYFIKLINGKHKLLEVVRPSLWKLVAKCFIKPDGNQFNPDNLRTDKEPKINKQFIEEAARKLKWE